MPDDDKLGISIKEAARLLGIGERVCREAVHQGKIPALRFGGRWVVSRFRLEQMMGATAPAAVPVEH